MDLVIYKFSMMVHIVMLEITELGNLRLKTNNMVELVFGGTNEVMGQFIGNAGVGLYYNSNKKFETTGVGATVFGTTQTQQLNVSGVSTFNDDVKVYTSNLNVYGIWTIWKCSNQWK